MKNYKLAILFIFIITGCALSCKKKKNDNPFGSSKISTITTVHAGTVTYHRIVYDAANNVDSIVIAGGGIDTGDNGFLAFNYFGSSFSVTDQTNTTTTVYANTNGMILKVLIADTISMIYNGSELGEEDTWIPQVASPYYYISRINYTWQNGDLTRDSTGGPAYTYDYDLTKAGQPGDAWRVDQFLIYGRSYIKTTHLVSDKMYGAAWIERYFYVFDGSGRINQFTKVTNNNGTAPDDTMVYNYSYY